jgi:pectin methylesterase-like acyl-CoA thioesterase
VAARAVPALVQASAPALAVPLVAGSVGHRAADVLLARPAAAPAGPRPVLVAVRVVPAVAPAVVAGVRLSSAGAAVDAAATAKSCSRSSC